MTEHEQPISLPDDIIQLIADELLAHRDFSTLYNLAVASKRLALCALPNLYRIYNESTDEEEESEGFQNAAHQELFVQRWAIKWRSIVLSCTGDTLFPYYRWLKILDLRDLAYLLADQKFRNNIDKLFFSGSLKNLRRQRHWRSKNKTRGGRMVLDDGAVVEAVADVLIPKSETLEQLSGPFQPEAFLRWIPSLRELQRLELFIGTALKGKEVHQAIYKSCPRFNSLSIFSWIDPNMAVQTNYDPSEADRELAAFFLGMTHNSLTTFESIRSFGISDQTCSALAHHAESLQELRMCLEKEAIPSLLLLRGCTKLRTLKLDIAGLAIDENSAKEDDLTELTSWLKDCNSLQSIEFLDVGFAPRLLTPVFESKSVALDELDVKANRAWYSMKDNQQFHRALATQKALRTLSLFGDAAGVTYDDNQTLIDSVCQCTKLRHLKLSGVSEYFSEEAVIRILTVLSNLVEVYIHGLNLTDNVLEAVATHPRLRSIYFMDLTTFTFEGLLEFVEKLDRGKKNFELGINMANTEHLLSDEEVQVIRQSLYHKVEGKLDYVPHRDPDMSDYSLESD